MSGGGKPAPAVFDAGSGGGPSVDEALQIVRDFTEAALAIQTAKAELEKFHQLALYGSGKKGQLLGILTAHEQAIGHGYSKKGEDGKQGEKKGLPSISEAHTNALSSDNKDTPGIFIARDKALKLINKAREYAIKNSKDGAVVEEVYIGEGINSAREHAIELINRAREAALRAIRSAGGSQDCRDANSDPDKPCPT